MALFSNLAITEGGRSLLADAQAGAVLIPTKIVIGSGNMPTGKTAQTMTAVVSPVKELAINKVKRLADGKVTFGGVYSNTDIMTAFYFRELALFCRAEYRNNSGNVTQAVGECLFCYGNAGGTADYMPAYSLNTVVERQIDITSWVGNDAQVSMVVNSGVYVTQEQLADAIGSIDLSIKDAGTGKKYKWGIENGLAFLEEV